MEVRRRCEPTSRRSASRILEFRLQHSSNVSEEGLRSLRRRNTHTRKAISLQGNSEGSYKKWALEDGSEGAVFGQGKPADQCWTLTSSGLTSPPRQIVTGHCLSPRQCSLGAAYPITLSAASRPMYRMETEAQPYPLL